MTTDLWQAYGSKLCREEDESRRPVGSIGRSFTGAWSFFKSTWSSIFLWSGRAASKQEPNKTPSTLSSNDARKNRNNMSQELQTHWQGRTVVRILIATQQENTNRKDFEAAKHKRLADNPLHDYFVSFGKKPLPRIDWNKLNDEDADNAQPDAEDLADGKSYVEDLFGNDFMSLLEQLKSKDGKAAISARASSQKGKEKMQEEVMNIQNARKSQREEAQQTDMLEGAFDLFEECCI